MKDLAEYILKNLSQYLPVLISVISSPNSTISKLIADEKEMLNNALIFCGITIALGFAFQAPLLNKGDDFVMIAGSMLVFKIFTILAFSCVILLSFRLLGGKGSFNTTLSAYLYMIGPLYLFVIILNIIGIGLISTYDAEVAIGWRSGLGLSEEHIQEFMNTSPIMAGSFALLLIIQLLLTPIWFAICWKTFRYIHHVSLYRSILAFLISVIVCCVVFILSLFVMKGLYSGGLPPIA